MAYLACLLAVLLLMRKRREARKLEVEDQNESLESKLRLLGKSATRASSLATQITIEIDAMSAKAVHAKETAENAEKIAALSETERAAVAAMVRQELGGQLQGKEKRDLKMQILLSCTFFVLGILASIFVVSPIAAKMG